MYLHGLLRCGPGDLTENSGAEMIDPLGIGAAIVDQLQIVVKPSRHSLVCPKPRKKIKAKRSAPVEPWK